MQVCAAALYTGCIEPGAQVIRARWRIGQAFPKRAEIQPGSDGKNRQTMTTAQILEDFERALAIFPRGEDFSGRDHIEHVVANVVALGGRRLCRTDIKTAIPLRRITGD